jgi:NitT/TauT family transport system ATP-binding protein
MSTAAASAAPATTKLSVSSVSKVFGGRKGSVTALEHVDLHVDDGELVCLLGASGCGKSTLLAIIGGLEAPTEGEVTVEGELVVGPGSDRGMVFQAYSLFPWKTVSENIAFGLEVARWPVARRRERVAELLGIMGLTTFADALPRELSGGMRQRVAIARALAPEPDMLLLDEPFGALDAETKRHMQDFLLTLWRRTGTTILMVTHDIEEAIYLSKRIYVLAARPGRVAAIVDIPFGANRGPNTKRDPRFLDLRDELADLIAG